MKSTAASVWIQKAAQFLTLIFALFPLCQLEAQETPLPYPLDLSAHYSSKFTTPKGTNNYYRNIAGPQIIDGLPFDVAGKIVMDGQNDSGCPAIEGIKIGLKFQELHLVHNAQWHEYHDCPIATIRLHYADGSQQDFTLRYAVQVMANRLLTEETEVLTDPDSKLVFRGPGPLKGDSRVVKTVLLNPFPEKRVETLDVISTRSRSSYVLMAATVADRDPQRPVTPPLRLNDPETHFDGALKIRAEDKGTGASLGGADIYPYMSVDGVGAVADPVLTSSNGVATVKYPIARTGYVGIRIKKPGYVEKGECFQRGSIPEEITYRLVAARAEIQGVVVDESGQPVSGAQVQLNCWQTDSRNPIELKLAPVTTDASGHWRLQGLPENYEDFSLSILHTNFPPTDFFAEGPVKRGFLRAMESSHRVSAADVFAGKAVLKLTAGRTLAGVIRDVSGAPVSGARIVLGLHRGLSNVSQTHTDTHGNFIVNNLGQGENHLTLSAPGFTPQFRPVVVSQTNAVQEIVLKPSKIIRGRVVDVQGKPLENAEVEYVSLIHYQRPFSGETLEWKTQTNPNGEFTWDSAPDEPTRLSISKSGYMRLEWNTENAITNSGVPQITLGNPLTIQGAVTDAYTGAPVSEFSVIPGFPNGDAGPRFTKESTRLGTNGHFEIRFDSPILTSSTPEAFDFILKIMAPGYAPVVSRFIKPDEGTVTWDVKLKKTPAVFGWVKTATGNPVYGVNVFTFGLRDELQFNGTEICNQNLEGEQFETDANGRFAMPPQTGDFNLAAASPAGFGLISLADFTNSPTLTLQPWCCLKGTLTRNGKPLAGRELKFSFGNDSSSPFVTVDAQGNFFFPALPPGDIQIKLKQSLGSNSYSTLVLESFDMKPGQTNSVELALNGREVTARLVPSADLPPHFNLNESGFFIEAKVANPPMPEDLETPEKVAKWYQAWLKTDAGKTYNAAVHSGCRMRLNTNGTLHAESVKPGKYTLRGYFWSTPEPKAEIENHEFDIPEISTGELETPFDLGEIRVKPPAPTPHLKVGDPAPEFNVKTLDGEPLKLSDFHGKYVLLDFWATWCGPCVAETPYLKAAYDAYGSDPRLVMISLSLDSIKGLPRKFAQTHDIKWQQAFLGDWASEVTKDYCVEGIPSIFLIGPDGKIIAQELRGIDIKSAVGSALARRAK